MSETTAKEFWTNPETYENVQSRHIPEKEEGKAYGLRKLEAKDVFIMSKILGAIGIDQFKDVIQSDAVKKAVSGKMTDDLIASVGVTVVLDMANIILNNLSKCEKDIYAFLSSLSGIDKKEIEMLPLVTFTEMIVDVIQKEEFKDFIKVVSKLFK